MAQQGATMQQLNNELVTCLEDLRSKRDEVRRQIAIEEEEKTKIQNDLHILTERLGRVTESLSRKQHSLDEFTRTIQETETAYHKILESSQTLLEFMKRETTMLGHPRH